MKKGTSFAYFSAQGCENIVAQIRFPQQVASNKVCCSIGTSTTKASLSGGLTWQARSEAGA
jgi:hypothetical protein